MAKTFNKLIGFTITKYTAFLCVALRGFAVAKLLGVEAFGVYSVTVIMQQQLSLFGLGVRESLSVIMASNSQPSASINIIYKSILKFCFSIFLILNSLAILLYCYELNLLASYPTLWIALQLASITIITEILASFTRARNHLNLVISAELTYALLSLLLVSLFFLFEPTVKYLLFALYLSSLTVLILYLWGNKDILSKSVERSFRALDLVKLGIPLLTQNMSCMFLLNFGHFYITTKNDSIMLSYYSFAFSIAVLASVGMQAVLWALYSKMLSTFNPEQETNTSKEIMKLTRIRLYLGGLLSLIMIFIISKIALQFFVDLLFPEYALATNLIPILILAMYLPIISGSEATFLMSKKRFKSLYITSISSVMLMVCFLQMLLLSFPLTNIELLVSFSLLIGHFFYFIFNKLITAADFGHTTKSVLTDCLVACTLIFFLLVFHYATNGFITIVSFLAATFLFLLQIRMSGISVANILGKNSLVE